MDLPNIYTLDTLNELDKEFNYMIYGQGVSLIVVEGSTAKRKTLCNELKKFGYDCVYDSAKALDAENIAKTAEGKIALLISYDLPKSDGATATKSFISKFPEAIVFILVNNNDPAIIQHSEEAGALAVLEKSTPVADICTKLKNFGLGI